MTKSKAPKKSQGNFEILVPRRGAPTRGADIIEDAVKTHANPVVDRGGAF
jgi:hypothetical protein